MWYADEPRHKALAFAPIIREIARYNIGGHDYGGA